MIEVELPGGEIVEFPAGTSEAVMQSAIRSHLNTQPSEQPAPPAAPRVPGAAGVLNWAARNPQDALDTLGTGVGAAGGMAVPGGPAIQIPMAGLGSAAGKRVARDIGSLFGFSGSEEYPSVGESTLDAAAGAAGPAASAVARPAARVLTGVTKEMTDAVRPMHAARREVKAVTDGIERSAKAAAEAAPKTPFDEAFSIAKGTKGKNFAAEIAKIASETRSEFDKATKVLVDQVTREATKTGKLPMDAGKLGALIMGVAHGDITSAVALFGAGVGASKARVEMARRLLRSERAVEWIVQRAQGGITPTGLLTSLSGLAAVKGMDAGTRADIRRLQGGAGESDGMQGDRDALERMMDGDGDGEEG